MNEDEFVDDSREARAAPPGRDRGLALIALLIPIAWWAVLSVTRPQIVGDELFHQKVIAGIASGLEPPPGYLTIPPTFHWIAAGITAPQGGALWTVRGVVVLFSLLLLLAAYTLFRVHSEHIGTRLLAIAFNPVLLPYTALAYTDVPAAALLVAAVAANQRRLRWLGAASAGLSTLIRQTSLIWFIALAFQPHHRRTNRIRGAVSYLIVGVITTGLLWSMREHLVGSQESNRPRFNPAQVYTFLLCIGAIWLPLWIEELARCWKPVILPALMRGWGIAGFLGLTAAAGLLFDNPHPWNADPEYLRNQLLVLIDTSATVRTVVCGFLVATGVAAVAFVIRQPERRTLCVIGLLCAAYILPHGMVDPRYYIAPLLALHLYMPLDGRQATRLAAWNALLGVSVCTYVATADGPGGIL